MDGLVVERVRTMGDLMHPQRLLNLVDYISTTSPYSYRPGEIRATADWFPDLIARAEISLVALRSTDPVGYCIAVPFETYGKLGHYVERLGIDPATTVYIAELGIAPQARRGGIASRLLNEAHAALPEGTTTCLVRTLADNDPAVALYRRHGYELVDQVTQMWNSRERIFLVRQRLLT